MRIVRIGLRAGLGLALVSGAALWIATAPLDRNPIVGTQLARDTRVRVERAATTALATAAQGEIAVGWSAADITPPAGTPTLGYGARMGEGAAESDYPLRAVAFALTAGNGPPVVLLTADLCFWPRELSQPLAARLTDLLPRERLLFGATHTHGGPGSIVDAPIFEPMFGAFSSAMADRILDGAERAVRSAIRTLEPGRYRFHEMHMPEFVQNRTGSGHPVNDLAVVLEFERSTGPRAALVTYSAHATVIAQESVVASADYPGAMTRRLESSGWETAGFFAAETAQSGPALDGAIASQVGTELAEEMGRRFADALAARMNEPAKKFRGQGRLATLRASIALPAWSYRVPFADRVMRPSVTRWLLGDRRPDAHVHALALDELLLVGHGFEQSAELGVAMRREAKQNGQILVPLSFNGEHHFYVVPEASFDAGGYEPTMAVFGPHLAAYLNAATRQVAKLLEMP